MATTRRYPVSEGTRAQGRSAGDHAAMSDRTRELYATWLESKGMQLLGTVSTLYPLSIRQHVQVGRLLQETYQVATGERPSVMVPCQRNPSRQGYHSHPSVFGSVGLQEPRRDVIWADVMARLTNEPGMGVETVSALVGRDRRGDFHWRYYMDLTPDGWQRLSQANEGRFRLEPCRTHQDALSYAVRYASRETDCLEFLPGDLWSAIAGGASSRRQTA